MQRKLYDLLMRQNKSSMKKIMRLILEEVIMSDVQMHSFLQYFLTLKKLG